MINKVLLTQPNYSFFGKRSWLMLPYTLGLLNACINNKFDSEIYDPNFSNHNEEEIVKYLEKSKADIVALSTISTDYIKHARHMTRLIRKALPYTKIILGGVFPTVQIEEAKKDPNVDFWMIREAEFRFVALLEELNKEDPNFSLIEGLSYRKGNEIINNDFSKEDGFIYDLDKIPLPDYGKLDILKYGNNKLKFSVQLVAQQYPFAISSTSRGCPFNCTFCSGWTVTGKKVRMRSAKSVLSEIDMMYKKGIREMIYLDDHFLFDRNRAIDIMKGLIERNYDLTWKCVNVNVSNLDKEILNLMKKSGSYQIAVAIESGNQHVLKNLIKKPFIDLKKVPSVLEMAYNMGFELIANFVIGYPHETWQQIRETFAYAEKLKINYAIFHIATPLPKTELMEMCISEGLLNPKDINLSGFCQPVISTKEFTAQELKILRVYEWDRINFSTEERRKRVAKMQGVTLKELEEWRKKTREKLGVGVI